MLLWVVGVILLSYYFGAACWSEQQRQEGTYGFVTRPGAPPEQVAKVATLVTPPAATRVAAAKSRAEVLPATAGPLPRFAFGAILSLLGAPGVRTVLRA
jgi:hypothetical protein